MVPDSRGSDRGQSGQGESTIVRRGFTLLQFLRVIVVWTVLVVVVAQRHAFERSVYSRAEQRRRALEQLEEFRVALHSYARDNGWPPSTAQGLAALLRPPAHGPFPRHWKGPYLTGVRRVPKDPWGNQYAYLSPGLDGERFMVLSYGSAGDATTSGSDTYYVSAW
jgi:general secretion pathway protein G